MSADTSHPAPGKESNAEQDQYVPRSTYQLVKDGWGSRTNFQASYLLGMDPDGLDEGSTILEALEEGERELWEAEHGGRVESEDLETDSEEDCEAEHGPRANGEDCEAEHEPRADSEDREAEHGAMADSEDSEAEDGGMSDSEGWEAENGGMSDSQDC